MKRTAAILMLMVFAFGSLAYAQNASTFTDAKAMAGELNKPLLVEFYTEW